MRRRQVIKLLGGATAAWPLAAHGQQPALPVIGFVHASSPAQFGAFVDAFRQGLKETGYIEGQNVTIEFRWAENHNERVPALIADLVQRHPSVLVAAPTVPALAAKAATATVPIVFECGVDPVAAGLVVSLNRPGGNITGIANLSIGLIEKQIRPKRFHCTRATYKRPPPRRVCKFKSSKRGIPEKLSLLLRPPPRNEWVQ